MRAVPGRCRIGRKSRVHDRDRRFIILVLKVIVESSQLTNQEHPFVDNRPRRERADICILRGLLELSSHNVEPAVEVDAFLYALRPFDKALADAGHTVDSHFSKNLFMHRNFAPAKDFHALFLRDHLEHALGKSSAQCVLRKEEHADAIVAFLGLRHFVDPGLTCRFCEEFVGDLRQNADAVTHLTGGVLAGSVLQLLHNVQRVIQNLVVLPAVDIYNTSDAAGIMFLHAGAAGTVLLLVQHSFSSFAGADHRFFPYLMRSAVFVPFQHPLRARKRQFQQPAYLSENNIFSYVGYGRYSSGMMASALSVQLLKASISASTVS